MSGDHNAEQGIRSGTIKRDVEKIIDLFGGLPFNDQGIVLGVLHSMLALHAVAEMYAEKTGAV